MASKNQSNFTEVFTLTQFSDKLLFFNMVCHKYLAVTICYEINLATLRAHRNDRILWETQLGLNIINDISNNFHIVAKHRIFEYGLSEDVIGNALLHTW